MKLIFILANTSLLHKKIEIKQFKSSNEKDLLLFMKNNLKNWEKFQRFWNWRKKNKNISGGSNAIIAIENNQHIVGTVGVVPAKVILFGRKIKISWQQNSLVSKSMRGGGAGKRLVKKGLEGWDMVIAKGTSRPMYNLRKRLGFEDVPNSDYLILIRKPCSILHNRKKSIIEHFLYMWQYVLPKPKKKSFLYVKSIDYFNNTFDIMASRQIKENAVRLYKDSAYLNWRYFTCPSKNYIVFSVQGKKSGGAIVLNTTGKNNDEGYIVDMICCIEDKAIRFALLQKAMEYFASQKVSRIRAFTTHPIYRKWFIRFGFVPTGISPRFTFWKKPGVFESTAFDNAVWDFWHGDGDIELYM